ncbi:MAG TPA: MBL fold metallo-hydrolase, partial [Flavobacterium sp.]|nr:MBL fold metallo-hydrolase [Flavobacterium sp.]
QVIPVKAFHGDLELFAYRIGEDFAYMTDVKTIAPEEAEKLKGVKVLVVSALREEHHDTHFNLAEALEFIEFVQPERAYLTHMSHHMGFHAEVEKKLPGNVFLAYDNLEITI